MENIIEVNGIKYKKVETTGSRAVIVLDRGWIYAGDVEEKDGRIYLTRVVWVFKWISIGFAEMLENPCQDKVDLRSHRDIDFPADVELFRAPVNDDWGIG
jgi:hypothetical protein